MIKEIQFYYDFSSPYTYIAHKKIKKIINNKDINFLYKPMLLGGLHKLAGITANAFIDHKNEFMIQDCEMISKKLGINFHFNEKFPINSLYLMRGYLFVKSDKKDKYFDLCFDAYWKNNEDISKEENIKNILSKCEIKPNDFKKGIEDQKIKNELKDLTNIAFQNDVFGAPTFVVNNNLFWGQDRLEYALDELNN